MSEIRRIDIDEFRTAGYLQEVNRQFFHPLGLALEVKADDDGYWSLGGVWDYRDDPEGMGFVWGSYPDHDDIRAKADRVADERDQKLAARMALYGEVVQPLPQK